MAVSSTLNIMQSLAANNARQLERANDSAVDKAKAVEQKVADIHQKAQQIIANPLKFSISQILNIMLSPQASKLIEQIQKIVAEFLPPRMNALNVSKEIAASEDALRRSNTEEAARRRLAEEAKLKAEEEKERKKAEEAKAVTKESEKKGSS